jgi:hypothetical protein
MTIFLKKLFLYIFLILVVLEILVRVFHLYSDNPSEYIDEYGVEKRVPLKSGYAIQGNRNQNISEFGINNAGFNSPKDYLPSKEKFEVAIVGDSYIEGFHQDYQNSIGRKIEQQIPGIEVYEYGYAGYDLADQLHLINAYKKDFELIDVIIVYMKFQNDLVRGSYSPNYENISTRHTTIYKIKNNIKLLAYGSIIGILDPVKNLATGDAFQNLDSGYKTNEIVLSKDQKRLQDLQYLDNFKSLIRLYGFDKTKTTILLDSRVTSSVFLEYCKENEIKYIDFSDTFIKSKKATNLIYDLHWNDYGRELIAKTISEYVSEKERKFRLNSSLK